MIAEPDWLTKLRSVKWSWRSRISSPTSASRSSDRDLLLLVGHVLEAAEGLVELLVGELVAELGQARAQRVPAAVLAEHEVALGEADVGGLHDLEGRGLLEDAVLVDARLVGEGVAADDRLVGLHRVAGHVRDQPAGAGDLLGLDLRLGVEVVAARADRHDDLFERGVAGALADAVDGALDLGRAGAHRGERVGRRQTEVVVAVAADGDVVQRRAEPVELADEVAELERQRVADGVGDVDRRRAALDGDAQDLGEELRVGAARVHGAELDVGLRVLAGQLAASETIARVSALTSSGVLRIWYFMCRGLVLMKVWMRGTSACLTASQQTRMSFSMARARPAMRGPLASAAIAFTASKSSGEAIGNPASMMSTRSLASCRATSSFSARFMLAPGACSPSRSVVSKILMCRVVLTSPSLPPWRRAWPSGRSERRCLIERWPRRPAGVYASPRRGSRSRQPRSSRSRARTSMWASRLDSLVAA